ncbi:tricarballylate utilization 4Fe-4S protein TcuB [Thiohalocapsa marina]|uniref:Tricarballylate utilization 4Fe-4S protein TcuB n=1 Tax=Thiohalocapsa marina TaxID=424902 RepID=A0A5M8FPU8_9GAMM|nr:tricarballylate utilization 4Fe-4S protein TcuB [Thiohalocapsa marina]KAA6186933.1 tricarballylate utilization 4Fe-4S protein TcuB [Thiohalocapsa marina]
MSSDECLHDTRAEARRVLGICNACGYCNGFCDLFEASKRRPAATAVDLEHLAHLCHGCRNCLYACQYAPPHAFGVNVPKTLARMRQRSYVERLWPGTWSGWLAAAFRHGVLTASLVSVGAIGLLLWLVWMSVPSEVLFSAHSGVQSGTGAFYRILPWWGMVLIGFLPLGWAMLSIGLSLRRYWRAIAPPGSVSWRALGSALHDVVVMRNLRGGGPGCNDLDDRASHLRRRLHQTLLVGLLLSFAATLAATFQHHVLGWQAPYPLLSAPVLLGTCGGLAMTCAVVGLARLKRREDRSPTDAEARSLDLAFLGLLFLVAVTGLVLLALRATPAMGVLLAVHLGTVLAFFLLLPYSKFVHAGYRLLSLLAEALERAGRQQV